MRAFDGMLVKIHAHQANDILTALRVGKEFGLNLSIEHCTEGWKMIDDLKEAKAHYIIGPTVGGKSKLECHLGESERREKECVFLCACGKLYPGQVAAGVFTGRPLCHGASEYRPAGEAFQESGGQRRRLS